MLNHSPLVSIIVPVFNAEKTLSRCINSIVNSTYNNIKIIIIDDGSTDDSLNIASNFANKYNYINVYHKENGGSDSARMYGIERLPKDGFTTFCDADDMMCHNGIKDLMELQLKTDSDVTCGTTIKMFGSLIYKKSIPILLQQEKTFNRNEIINKILPGFFGVSLFSGYLHTKLYKNELLFNSKNFVHPCTFFQEDIAFNLQIMLLSKKVSVTPKSIIYYNSCGGTSRFMPCFLNDCISLYIFKLKVINEYKLAPELFRTTYIEMKNELYTWLLMYYKQYRNKGRNYIEDEINKSIESIPSMTELIANISEDKSGVKGFNQLLINKNTFGIYRLISKQEKYTRVQDFVKRIISKI